MELSNEFVAGLATLFITLLMNLIIKYIETRKPKEELDKTALEAADLSFDFLKESLAIAIQSIKDRDEKIKTQEIRIKELDDCMEAAEKEIEILHEEMRKLKEDKGE